MRVPNILKPHLGWIPMQKGSYLIPNTPALVKRKYQSYHFCEIYNFSIPHSYILQKLISRGYADINFYYVGAIHEKFVVVPFYHQGRCCPINQDGLLFCRLFVWGRCQRWGRKKRTVGPAKCLKRHQEGEWPSCHKPGVDLALCVCVSGGGGRRVWGC